MGPNRTTNSTSILTCEMRRTIRFLARLLPLQHSITAIQAAVEAGQQPFQDSIDNELDSIKNELERHEIHVADRLASALTNESPISCRRGSDGVCCQSKPISSAARGQELAGRCPSSPGQTAPTQ